MRFYISSIFTSGAIILLGHNSFTAGQIPPSLNFNSEGTGCVDPKDFVSCYATVSNTATSTCVNDCNKDYQQGTTPYQQCLTACNDNWYAGNIGCWLQSCWNQVYSCEYQLTAIVYFHGIGNTQGDRVPYFPAPPGVSAGACSCNLGWVNGNLTATNNDDTNCLSVAGFGSSSSTADCSCCEFSWAISNSLNACPTSNLSVLGFPADLANAQNQLASSPDGCNILNTNGEAYITQYSFPFDGSTAYNPLSLPATAGTAPLTNTPGNPFTEIPTPTYTLELLPVFTSVIMLAPFSAGAEAENTNPNGGGLVSVTISNGSVSGGVVASNTASTSAASGSGLGTDSGTGTATGSTASSTPTKAGAGMRNYRSYLLLVGFVMATFYFL